MKFQLLLLFLIVLLSCSERKTKELAGKSLVKAEQLSLKDMIAPFNNDEESGNSEKDNHPDTLMFLELKEKQFAKDKYKILHIHNRYNKKRFVGVSKNGETISSFSVPNPTDVKNFSLNKLHEIENGFRVDIDWGGGNNFYKRNYYFHFMEDRFVFTQVDKSNYNHGKDKEEKTLQKVDRPIMLENFDILEFIQ